MSKYGIISGPYFPVFGLNTEIYGMNLRIQSEYRKYGPEITPYLDTFHAVKACRARQDQDALDSKARKA